MLCFRILLVFAPLTHPFVARLAVVVDCRRRCRWFPLHDGPPLPTTITIMAIMARGDPGVRTGLLDFYLNKLTGNIINKHTNNITNAPTINAIFWAGIHEELVMAITGLLSGPQPDEPRLNVQL